MKPYSPTPVATHPHLYMTAREMRRRTPWEMMLDARVAPGNAPPYHKSRNTELAWTAPEDALLKQLAERWPNNWALIADAFNSSRTTLTADRRSAADCYERWRMRAGFPMEDDRPPPPTPSTSMTTRGTKRSMSMSISTSGLNGNDGSHNGESKKRRRHTVMYDIVRKAAKKKEAAQKANGMLQFLACAGA